MPVDAPAAIVKPSARSYVLRFTDFQTPSFEGNSPQEHCWTALFDTRPGDEERREKRCPEWHGLRSVRDRAGTLSRARSRYTHGATLEDGPELYKTFRAREDGCITGEIRPNG